MWHDPKFREQKLEWINGKYPTEQLAIDLDVSVGFLNHFFIDKPVIGYYEFAEVVLLIRREVLKKGMSRQWRGTKQEIDKLKNTVQLKFQYGVRFMKDDVIQFTKDYVTPVKKEPVSAFSREKKYWINAESAADIIKDPTGLWSGPTWCFRAILDELAKHNIRTLGSVDITDPDEPLHVRFICG